MVKEMRDDLCLRIVYPSLSEKARDETIIFCEKHVFENVLALINREDVLAANGMLWSEIFPG